MNKNMNKNPFEYFDAVYCINLDKRPDRWKECLDEFEKLGITDLVTRFSATEHYDGRIGIIRSTSKLLSLCKQNGFKNVLILEDDVKFINDTLTILNDSINQLPTDRSPDILYLGANLHNRLPKFSKNLSIINNAFALHSYCVYEHMYDTIINFCNSINKIKTGNDIIDVWIANNIQNKNNSFVINPIITTQRSSYSNIENRTVDYNFIEERSKLYL